MKRPLGPVLSVLTLWSCSDARLVDGISQGQTKIRVSPQAFIGDVPCVRGATGGLVQYVVQLQELGVPGENDAGLEPTPSPPVPCDRSVSFAATPTRFYAADILGFDVPIEPDDVGTVEPRWTASCGRGDPAAPADAGADPFAPTLSIRGATVPLRGCTTFGGGVSNAELAVDLASALGDLQCGEAPGQVASIEAVLGASRRVAACGEPLVFTIATPGGVQTIELTGYEALSDASSPPAAEAGGTATDSGAADAGPSDAAPADATADSGATPSTDAGLDAGDGGPAPPIAAAPTWRTRCEGRALAGVRRTATCEPFARVLP